MLDLAKIDTLILDLGGVIINIDPMIAFKNFALQANRPIDEIADLFKKQDIFHRHEIGELSDNAFYVLVQEALGMAKENITIAWNSLLLDIPHERIELLRQLGKSYKLILLSNTNAIHIEAITAYLKTTYDTSLDTLFDQVYLSHQIKLRKPDKEIYQFVVKNSNIDPARAVFIDDVYVNAKSAELAGIKGFHLDLSNHTLVDIFEKSKAL